MPAVQIGSPSSNNKTLRRADFSTERNGLETLNEIYTIRTANRATLKPDFGDLHKDYSTATTKFSRMSVENFSFREQDGDLTEMNVTYVGLTSSTGLPPALVRLIPTPGAGIYGPQMIIEAEYLTDKTETQFIQDGCGGQIINVGVLLQTSNAILMPSFINGTPMPKNPREPFRTTTNSLDLSYHGYLQASLGSINRGLFLVVKVVFQEGQSGLVGGSFSPFDSGR